MGDGTESLVLNPSQRERLGSFDIAAEIGRERLGSFDAAVAAEAISTGKEGSLDDNNKDNQHAAAAPAPTSATIAAARDRLSGIGGGRRDRLESWGGMSDLSATGLHDQNSDTAGSGGMTSATALAATIYTSLANDVAAAAGVGDGDETISSFLVNEEAIPTKISVNRDRLNSVATFGTDASALFQIAAPSSGSVTDFGFSTDVQKYVKEAMASVEDELADLVTNVEAVAAGGTKEKGHESEVSSTASPMIGAASDIAGRPRSSSISSLTGRPRSSSVSSFPNIAVDFNAVQAAVNAAETVDLDALGANSKSGESTINRKKRSLPLNNARSKHQFKQQTTANRKAPPDVAVQRGERDMEAIRARARAAAGYVPPGSGSLPPPKKRKMFDTLSTPSAKPPLVTSSNFKTPVASNTSRLKGPVPYPAYSGGTPGSSGRGPASQKWEQMFDCLIVFIEVQKKAETKGLSEAQKREWEWDGNVPTTYKTKDGKALGRWVNNQRSAKSKGTLKEEREIRLVNAGLKWSVLASSSWNDMLEELRVYIAEIERQGKIWNGNGKKTLVPTNYKIKVSKDKKPCFKDDDEDKNLGRWVNRQRSMYQSGKLRKDRQEALENIGLKWSVLATTTWDSMFETLEEYVNEKTRNGSKWDGNVPANYRTNHDPPRALGRWINRQRSAYGKNKIKIEYEAKLNNLGLKWSVHERRPGYQYDATPDEQGSSHVVSSDQNSDPQDHGDAADGAKNGDGEATVPAGGIAIKTENDSSETADGAKLETIAEKPSDAENSSDSADGERPGEKKDGDDANNETVLDGSAHI
ncbi:MAG: hypothetical protein SGILL_007698 [Bacillariaceae sp.]